MMIDIQRELKTDLTSTVGVIETQEGIFIPLKEVERMLLKRIEQVKKLNIAVVINSCVHQYVWDNTDDDECMERTCELCGHKDA